MEVNESKLDELFGFFKDEISNYINNVSSDFLSQIDSLKANIREKDEIVKKLTKENNDLKIKVEALSSEREKKSDDKDEKHIQCLGDKATVDHNIEQNKDNQSKSKLKSNEEIAESEISTQQRAAEQNSNSNYVIPMGYAKVIHCPLHKNELIKKQMQVTGRLLPLSPIRFQEKLIWLGYCPRCNAAYISINDKEELERKYSMYEIKTINFEKFKMKRASKNPLIKKLTDTERRTELDFGSNLNSESYIHQLGYNIQLPRDERWNKLLSEVLPRVEFDEVVKHIQSQIDLKGAIVSKDYSNAIAEWRHDLNKLWELAL